MSCVSDTEKTIPMDTAGNSVFGDATDLGTQISDSLKRLDMTYCLVRAQPSFLRV